ncbi:hypothetical protein GGF31_006426 [Allomyces arbusculus]|nr:hypothetical protein GGF31_006426 [Allomyces arbusculus]
MPSPLSQPVLGAAPTGQQPTLVSAFTSAPVAHAAEADNYLASTAGHDTSMPPTPPAAAYILHDYSDATVAPDPADLNDRGDIVKTKVRGSTDDDRALAPEPTGIRKLLRTRRRKVAACCAVFVLLLLIFLAIAYWVILPKIVRNKFAASEIIMYPDSVDVDLYATSPQLHVKMDSSLYVVGTDMEIKFDPETWIVKTGDGVNLIDELPMPAKITYPDKRYDMKMDSNVKLGNLDQVGRLLRELSSSEGISNDIGNIEIHTKMGVTVFGMHLYGPDSIAAVKKYDLRGLSFAKIFDNMIDPKKTLPGYLGQPSPKDPTLEKYPRPKARETGPIVVKSIGMTTTDKGFTVTADIDYDSALPFQVSLPGLSTEIHLYDTPVLRIGVRDLDLKRGAANMKPSIDIELLSTDYAKIGQLLKDAIFEYLDKGSFPVAITGPLQLQTRESKDSSKVVTADWMAQMTKPLAVNIPPALFAKFAGDAASDNSTFNISAGGLDVKVGLTMDAEKITVPINVTLPKSLKLPPLKLDYDLGVGIYTDNTKFLGIALTNVDLAAPASDAVGNKLTATLVLTPENKDMAPAKAVAKLVDNVLYTSSVSQIVVKDIAVIPHKGVDDCKWCKELFSKLDVPVPIQPIPLKDTLKKLVSAPASNATSSASGMKLEKLDIKQEMDSPALTITADLDVGSSLSIISQAVIPFAKIDLQLDDSTLISVSLPKGVTINGDSAKLQVVIKATFGTDGDIQSKVATFVSRFLGTADGASKLAITGVQLGVPDKPFRTFELINVHVTTDEVKEIMAAMPASSGSGLNLPAGLLKPTYVDVAMIDKNTIMAAAGITYTNPFPVSVSIGSLSLSALLNDQTLVGLTLPPITIEASGTHSMELKEIKLALGTSDALPQIIADIVAKVLAKQSLSGFSGGVTGITLGATKPDASITTFAKVKVTQDLGKLMDTLSKSPSSSSLIDTSAILPSPLTLPTPKLANASIATKAGATLAIGAALDFTNPTGIAVKIPYIQLSVGIDGTELVGITISGLDLKRGTGRLSLDIGLHFNNDDGLQTRVAKAVGQVLASQNVEGNLTVGGIYLGVAPKETTALLSKVVITVPLSTVAGLAGNLGAGNNPNAPSPLSGLFSGTDLKPSFKNIRVATLDGSRVQVGVSASFNFPLPVSIDIGYLALQLRVSGAPLVGVSVSGLKVNGGAQNTLDVNIMLDFFSGMDTQVAVRKLVQEVLYAKQWTSTIGVSSLVLGVDDKDTIRTFSKITIDLPLTTFLSPGSIALPSLGGGSSSSSLLSMLKDLRVEVMTGKRINIKTTLGVSLPLSLDIGFVSFNLAFDRMTLAKVSINGIKTASDKPDISLDVDLFIQDPPELQADLARFVKDVMTKKADLNYFVGIGALRFGKDSAKPIETSALVQIDLPLSALGITGASLSGMMSSGGSSLPIKFGGVKDIKVATQPGDRVSVDLVANLELPFKVTLIIPYISLRLKIDDLQILTIKSGIKLAPDTKDVAVSVSLAFDDNDATQTKVAQLVDQVLNGKATQVASQLIVTGIEVGANLDDKIMLLSQIQIALPLKDLLASAGGLSLGGFTTTTNGTAAIAPKLIKVEAKSGAVVEIGLQAELGFSFPIDVDIGYIQAAIGLNGNPMVVLSVNGIRINPKSKDLSITVVANFQDSDQLANDLSATIGAVLRTFAGEKNVDIPGKLTVGGLLFGVSDKDNIALLSKTTLGMAVKDLLAKLPSGGTSSLPIKFNGLSNITLATLPGDVIHAGLVANVGLPLKLDVSIPYIGVGIALDRTALAKIAVGGLRIQPNSNDIALSIDIQFIDNDATQTKVAEVVKAILFSKDPVTTMAVVTGFEFGVSPQDRVTTFSKVVAGAKVADLVTMVKGQLGGSSSSGGSSLIAGISDVDIAVQAGSKLSLSLALALNQSIPADINIGFVGATLGLNGNDMVSIAVDGIKATPATKKLAIKVSAEFFASQALGNDLRTLVLAVLQKKEVTGFLSVSRIVFGAKPDDNIALFSRAMIAVPVKDLLAMATAGGSTSSLPMPKIKGFKDLKVIARPGDVIDTSFKLGLELPFNVSLSAPFIGLGLAVDKTPIVKVGVQGVVISPTQQDLSLGVRIQVVDTPEAQDLVAALVKSVLFEKNPVTNILMIAGIQIGVLPTDVIKTLEAVVVPIPLQDLLKDLPASLPGAGGNSTLSLPPISAKNVSLDVQAGGLIDVKLVAVLTNLTFPAEIDIGYTSLTLGLNQNRLMTVAIDGLKVAPTTKELGLHLTLQFHDSDAVATDIAALFTAVFNKREVTGFATLSGIVFGASRDDNIALLSKAVVAIPLSTFSKQLAAIPDAISGIMAGVGKNPLPVKLKSVNFKALPGAIFDVATQLDLGIQIPLSANLGFFNLDIQLGPLKALSLQVSGVKVTPDTKELSLALRVQIYDTPQLADVLAKVTGDIAGGNLNQVIVLTGVKLGVNADDNIKALSKVALPFNLEPLLKSAMGQLPATGGNSTSSGGILDAIKPQVTEVKLATLPQRIISLTAKASFSNPLPFNVDLGFLAVGVGVDGERIADVRVRGFTMAPGNNGINLDLSMQLSQGNADVVGGAVMDLLRGDFKDHRVSVLGLELGASESDHVRALSKSRIDVPFKALTTPEAIAKLRESLPAMLAGAGGNLPVQFSDIKLNAQSPGKFIVTFAGAFTNETSVTADVGFLQLAVAIGPKPDAMPSPPLVAIQLRGVKVEKNQLSGMIVLVPFDTDGNQAIVAGLVQAIMAGAKEVPDFTAFAGGFVVGSDDKDKSEILSKTALAVPVRAILKPSSGGSSSGSGLALPQFNVTNVAVEFVDKYTVRAGARIAVTNQTPLSAAIGFVSADAAVNGLLFANIATEKPVVIAKGNNAMDVSVLVAFNKDAALEDAIASLVKAVLAGQLKGIELGVTHLILGADRASATKLFSQVNIKQTIALASNSTGDGKSGGSSPSLPSPKIGGVKGSLNPAGIHAVVDLELPFTFTLKGLKSLNVGLRAKGNPLINVAVQGLALDNSNKLSPAIDANIASVQVAAGTMQYVYESIKAGKSFEGLSVNGVALVLSDGSTFSLLSKIAADLPASKMDDFKFLGKIYNALKGEIDTKTLLEFSIPVEIAVGSLDFDVHTERGKVGEVRRRNLVINSNDGGFVVRIRSTLGLDIIELGRVLLNFEKEEKFLKSFNVKDPSGQDVAWATTVFNAVNVRLIPKWGKFDSPADI